MVRLLHWLIRFYQIAISPLLGPRCRYIPTCSQYSWKQSIHMELYVVCGWLLSVFAVVIRGVALDMIRFPESDSFYFISANRFSNASRCCTLS